MLAREQRTGGRVVSDVGQDSHMHSPCQKSPEKIFNLMVQQYAYCKNIKVHDGLVVQTMSADHFSCSRRPGYRSTKQGLQVEKGTPHRTTRKFASFLCRRNLCFCCQASETSALGPSWAVMLNLQATDSIRLCMCLKVSAEGFAAWRCGSGGLSGHRQPKRRLPIIECTDLSSGQCRSEIDHVPAHAC